MTQPIHRTGIGPHGPPGADQPRMLLKTDSAKTGYVDGAWWPYTDDLAAELPVVLTLLAARLGAIHRVAYHLHEWASVPDEFDFAGQAVQLDGYGHGTAHTVEVLGPRDRRLILLVVAPGTPAHRAFSILTSASAKDNESTVEELLMIDSRERAGRTGRAAALRRWRRELEVRRIGWAHGARSRRP